MARPLWDVYLGKNGEAVASGASHFPFIAPEPFYQWFIWIGGSGATLACVSYDYIWSIKIFKSIIENMYCPWDF